MTAEKGPRFHVATISAIPLSNFGQAQTAIPSPPRDGYLGVPFGNYLSSRGASVPTRLATPPTRQAQFIIDSDKAPFLSSKL